MKFKVNDDGPVEKVSWTKLKPGDLVAIKYTGTRQYGHIGVLDDDADRNGLLDGPDIVIHAGPRPLCTSTFAHFCMDGEVVILRPAGPAR